MLEREKLRVLTRATLNGLAGRVVARGPPVAHPWCKVNPVSLHSCQALAIGAGDLGFDPRAN